MNEIMKLGISGDAGSFSEEAALHYMERNHIPPSLVYLIDMEGVLKAVEEGHVDVGIFPVVNLRGGLVKPAFIAMGNHLFTPYDELWLEVRQCILTFPGTHVNQIKKIVSHPQAFAQCKHYLEREFKHAELVEWIDTAKAARDLSEGKLPPSCAVIAPERSAQIYHLEVMDKNVQDDNPNLTAFILVKKHASKKED